MSKDKTKKKVKQLRGKSAGQKGAIIGLSVALALAGGAAVAAPLIVMANNKGDGKSETTFRKVTFDSQGGSTVDAQEVADGKTAVAPVPPTKTNMSFSHWCTDQACQNKFDFTTPITGDIKLYACWIEKTVTTITVKYLSGDHGTFQGGGTSASLDVEDNQEFKDIFKPGVVVEDGYANTGWTDEKGEEIDPSTKITESITIKAKYVENPKKNTIVLSTEAGPNNPEEYEYPWDVTIKGQSTIEVLTGDYPTFKELKNTLPVAACADFGSGIPVFEHWSLDRQTEKDTLPTEVPETTPIAECSKLYPVFSFAEPESIVTLNVHIINDEYHKQTLTRGTSTIEVNCKAQGAPTNKHFKDVNKPEIYEYNKTFNGYYKSYDESSGEFSDQWANDGEIYTGMTDTEIYVKMDELITDPVITFEIDEEWEQKGHTNFKWVGNKTVKISAGDKLSDIPAPNVYTDAEYDPNPAIGFKTDYYFEGWFKKGDANKEILKDSQTFSASCTLCPKFALKTNVVFKTAESTTYSARYVDETQWPSVVKPTYDMAEATDKIFAGWEYKIGDDEFLLTDSSKVQNIPKLESSPDDPTTQTILPYLEDETNCHKFHFETGENNARIKDTQELTTVEYVGADYVGILKSDADIVVNDWLNKPTIPHSKEGSTKPINTGITFNNEWEISTDETNWTELTNDYKITGGTAPQDYYVRPIVISNIDVKFDAGDGTIVEWEEEEPYTHTISIEPGTRYSSMFRPEVTPPAGKTFLYWADEAGNKINPTHEFNSSTTLYAKYATENVGYTINFRVAKSDLENPDFPAEKINDDNCFKVSISALPNTDITFGQFAQPTATKPCHYVSGWYYIDEDGNEVDCTDDLKITSDDKGLDVYARFSKSTNYSKITIAPYDAQHPHYENEPQYYVDGDSLLYTPYGTTPINSRTKQWEIDGFESDVWAVGYQIAGWKQSDGTDLPSSLSGVYENVYPVFEQAAPLLVSFKTSEDYTLSSTSQSEILVNDKLINYINKAGWAPTATKTKAVFDKWAIYNGENEEPTPIEDNYRVTQNITLVPQFIDESIFEGSTDAYYYDEDVHMWAAIKSYTESTDDLYVRYQDNTEGTVSKTTFNYEIKFGSQMTKLPDYFMCGCTNWNNGGQPLYLPTCLQKGTKSSILTEIGKNVMYGCTSFNQEVHILADTIDDKGCTLKIGPNFMRGCVSFNKDIYINFVPHQVGEGSKTWWTEGNIAISDGFMFECNNFAKTLDLTGWSTFLYLDWLGQTYYNVDETYFYSCLSTTDKDYQQFTVNVNSSLEETFKKYFPVMDGITSTEYPYRWTYRNINVVGK